MAPWTATGAGCRSARARTCTSATGRDIREEAIAWLLGPSPLHVLDVGAGTGKLTRALLAAGHDVVAVEPDPEMRAAFAAAVPKTEVLEGAAEELPGRGRLVRCRRRRAVVPLVRRVARPARDRARPTARRAARRDLQPPRRIRAVGRRARGDPPGRGRHRQLRYGRGRGGPRAAVRVGRPGSVPHEQTVDVPGSSGWPRPAPTPSSCRPTSGRRCSTRSRRSPHRVAAASPTGELRLPYVSVCRRARRLPDLR